jgi:hypothetical protein
MLFGDAKDSIGGLVSEFKDWSIIYKPFKTPIKEIS